MGEIILHGDCLVNRVGELHKLLLHLLDAPEEQVDVDMSATGKCDTAFFQLICSACRSYSQKNKRLVLRSAPPPAVAERFRKAGFIQACEDCDNSACLFKQAFCDKEE